VAGVGDTPGSSSITRSTSRGSCFPCAFCYSTVVHWRPAGETCAVLLAPVGRGTSDAPAVQGDVAADLGVAVAGGVRAGGCWPGERLAKGKKEGWPECPRIAPKRTQVTGWLRPGRGTTHFSWVMLQLPATRVAENLLAVEAISVKLFSVSRSKWKPRLSIGAEGYPCKTGPRLVSANSAPFGPSRNSLNRQRNPQRSTAASLQYRDPDAPAFAIAS
jgi:hypothetical protein